MAGTLSDPAADWEGFEAIGYTLDFSRLKQLRIELVEERASRSEERTTDTTVGDLIDRCVDETIQVADETDRRIRTPSGVFRVRGSRFGTQMLLTLLRLKDYGVSSRWFWYDQDAVRDDPHDGYLFFIVNDGRIVVEQQLVGDSHQGGFDPAVFVAPDYSEAAWCNEPDSDMAEVAFYYREFYTTTRVGRLMALRPDLPKLHFYPEGRATQMMVRRGWNGEHDELDGTLQAPEPALQEDGVDRVLPVIDSDPPGGHETCPPE